MKFLILISQLIFFSSASYGNAFEVKVGEYTNGNFEISVRTDVYEKEGHSQIWYEVRARGESDGRFQFVQFYFDPISGNATKTPWRSGHGQTLIGNYIPDGDFVLLSSTKNSDGDMSFRWKNGGAWKVEDQITEMTLSKSGHILSLATNHKIAKWSLPNGWHSGPLKQVFACFECGDLRFISKEEQKSPILDLDCVRLLADQSAPEI